MTRFESLELPVAEIVAAYAAGAGIATLAGRYRVASRTIRRRLVAAGVTIRSRGGSRGKRTYDLEAARRMYSDGLTVAAIAAALGHSYSALYHELVLSGWQARPTGWHLRLDPQVRAAVARLANRNVVLTEIARINGVSLDYVKRVVREDGIERQTCGPTTAPMRRVFLYGPGDRPLQRWCAECRAYHRLEEFGRNRRLKHGVSQSCRRCAALRTQRFNARKRQQEQETGAPR